MIWKIFEIFFLKSASLVCGCFWNSVSCREFFFFYNLKLHFLYFQVARAAFNRVPDLWFLLWLLQVIAQTKIFSGVICSSIGLLPKELLACGFPWFRRHDFFIWVNQWICIRRKVTLTRFGRLAKAIKFFLKEAFLPFYCSFPWGHNGLLFQ